MGAPNSPVLFRDLPDQRNFIKNNVGGQVVLSPFTIQGTNPILEFDDTNGENFQLNVDTDILSILNTTGPITFVRFRGGASDDVQFDRPVVFNSTITLPEDITLSGASPSISMIDTGGDDLIITVDADVATFAFGGLNHFRLRGAANDDIQVDRPIVFNSSVTFSDITLSDATPTITLTDTDGDDFTIAANGGLFTITNTTQGTSQTMNQQGFWRLIPLAFAVNGGSTGNVTTGLDNLHSFTIQANQLANDGDYLRVRIAGTFAINNNDKRIQITLDSQVIDNQALFDQDSGNWTYDIYLLRTSAITVRFSLIGVWGLQGSDGASVFAGNGKIFAGAGTVTVANLDSNAVVFQVQAEGTATDDIVQTLTIAELVQLT